MAKPTSYLDWVTDGAASKQVEPNAAKKLLGWVGNEPPPFEYFNWLFYLQDQWLKYLESVTDEYLAIYDAIVGTGVGATHATLQAAIDAASVGWNIFVAESATIDADIIFNAPDISVTFKDGVTYTKGTATDCLNVQNPAARTTIRGGRFSGFTNGIDLNATVLNVMIRNCRFAGCTTDIADNGNPTYSVSGIITE